MHGVLSHSIAIDINRLSPRGGAYCCIVGCVAVRVKFSSSLHEQ